MGLDVYMYRHPDLAEEQRLEALGQAKYDEVYKAALAKHNIPEGKSFYDKDVPNGPALYDESVSQPMKAYYAEIGLDASGDAPGAEKIELNSEKYPEHMFKIGYFRSSYNSGGINRVLRNLFDEDLYSLFALPDDHGYILQPDWAASRERVLALIERYKKTLETEGDLHVAVVKPNVFGNLGDLPMSEHAALEIYRKEFAENGNRKSPFGGGGYSNAKGEFMFENPLTVVAVLPGFDTIFGKPIPCSYVIYKHEAKGDDSEKFWYLQALEIVLETIDWVLAQPDRDKLYFHWSS